MYKFKWEEIITDNLIAELSNITGIVLEIKNERITSLLTSIFKAIGGLPISKIDLSEDEKTTLAIQLLSEALSRYLFDVGVSNPPMGYYLSDSIIDVYEKEITGIQKINVNSANLAQLIALPVIGEKIAERIITSRNEDGFFTSFGDLIERIKGLGVESKYLLENAVYFENPIKEVTTRINLDTDFKSKILISMSRFSGNLSLDKFILLLDVIASTLSNDPHPKSRDRQIRTSFDFPPIEMLETDYIIMLENNNYFEQLPIIIKGANHSIKLAMFHIAFPKENHPTKVLLDELVNAKNRGVEVKVLLDRDREFDPYKSTVINTLAKEYLEANGVACRFDKEEVLLHSKYMVIDDDVCVLGSHNWSAGSYFQFDDLSLVVKSGILSRQLSQRFETLWSL